MALRPGRDLPLRAALLLLLAALASGAQTPPAQPQQPGLTVPVSTEVVRLDVIVTDKGGKARPGLKLEDFQVLEDGQPQVVTRFEAFVQQAPVPAAAPAQQAALPPPETTAAPAQPMPRRYVVIAIDDIHIEASNLIRLKKTLDRFLERELPPEDIVALTTTSGSRSQDFTEDRHTLRQVVAQLTLQERRVRAIDVPYIDEYQAERIEMNDPEALNVAVQEILARRRSPNAEQEARMFARAVFAEAVQTSRITMDTLDNVVRGMSELRGRKVVVLVSDGFTSGLALQSRAGYDLRRITDAGTRSGVIVYALDSRGLQASNSGFSASNRGPVMTNQGTLFGAKERIARQGEIASQDAMHAMAADTGGFLVANTNNLSDALRRIMRDTEAYYLLAYEPTSTKCCGEFRKIEVRVPGVKDLRIRHRKGYFAPGAGTVASASAPGGGGAATSPIARLRDELREALTSPKPLRDLPVSLSADFVSVDAARTQVVVSGHVDLRDVPFVRTDDRRLATIDVAGAVFDESGAVIGSLEVERATLDLTDAVYQGAIAKGLPYRRTAPLAPGRYRVCIAVREEAGGKLGNATSWVEIPDLAQGEPMLSSLFLMKEDGAPRGQGAGAGGSPSLRQVQAHRVYGRSDSLYVQFFAYNLARDGGRFVSQTEIWRGGALLAASPRQPIGAPGDASTAHTRKIRLTPFDPGDYEVRIVLTEEQTSISVSERAAFTIE
jgi:VWFA-related protein